MYKHSTFLRHKVIRACFAKRNRTVMVIITLKFYNGHNRTLNNFEWKSRLSFFPGDPVILATEKSGSMYELQGDTKKTVITKNRITSKILFRLTQNFSYFRSSLCSRYRQSFKSVLQKLFVSLALKMCSKWAPRRCRHIWIRRMNRAPTEGSHTFGSGGWPGLPGLPLSTQICFFSRPRCLGLIMKNPVKSVFFEVINSSATSICAIM